MKNKNLHELRKSLTERMYCNPIRRLEILMNALREDAYEVYSLLGKDFYNSLINEETKPISLKKFAWASYYTFRDEESLLSERGLRIALAQDYSQLSKYLFGCDDQGRWITYADSEDKVFLCERIREIELKSVVSQLNEMLSNEWTPLIEDGNGIVFEGEVRDEKLKWSKFNIGKLNDFRELDKVYAGEANLLLFESCINPSSSLSEERKKELENIPSLCKDFEKGLYNPENAEKFLEDINESILYHVENNKEFEVKGSDK